jgi:dephospho-CoA kinase
MFAAHGVPVLDLDQVGAGLISSAGEMSGRLAEAFGDHVLNPDGSVDRRKLAQWCFSDAARASRLNAMMHPAIWERAEAWLDQQEGDYAIIEASVLIESGGADRVQAVIVILADEQLRRQRVRPRPGMSAPLFDNILRRQCTDKERRVMADYVIDNNGSMEELGKHIRRLHDLLLARFMSGDAGGG